MAVAEYTEEEGRTLQILRVVGASFSLIGSAYILATWLLVPKLRSFAYKLVALTAFCDFMLAMGTLLVDTSEPATTLEANSARCTMQAVLISYFGLASLLWSESICWTMYKSFLKESHSYRAESIEQYSKKYFLICFGYPVLWVLLPFSTDSYGESEGACWIRSRNAADTTWRFLQFYIPMMVAVIWDCWVCWQLWHKLKGVHVAARKESGNIRELRGSASTNMIARIKYYPMVLIFTFSFAMLDALYQAGNGGKSSYGLAVPHVFLFALQGMFNSLVYGATPSVRQHVGEYLQSVCDRVRGVEQADKEEQSRAAGSEPSQPGAVSKVVKEEQEHKDEEKQKKQDHQQQASHQESKHPEPEPGMTTIDIGAGINISQKKDSEQQEEMEMALALEKQQREQQGDQLDGVIYNPAMPLQRLATDLDGSVVLIHLDPVEPQQLQQRVESKADVTHQSLDMSHDDEL